MASAQGFPDLQFTHLTDRDGLSNNKVTAIAQDGDGVIWVGTENGLNRFDGYGFRNYYADPGKPRSIPNSFISMIVPGKGNTLWVSTTEGVFRFDTRSQEAKRVGSFSNPYRPYLYTDSTKLPWVATGDGLYHYTDSAHCERMDEGLADFPDVVKDQSNVPRNLVEDHQGHLWGTSGNLIFRLGASKKVDKVIYFPRDWLIQNLFFDRLGHCWLCAWGKGLYLFDTEHLTFQRYHATETAPIIFGGAEWSLGGKVFIVFSCPFPGLLFIDEQDLSLRVYHFNPGMMVGGPPFVDKQDILWIPSSEGLYYVPPSDNLFSVIPARDSSVEAARSLTSYVYNMRETAAGYWVARRPGGGLLWYDRNWKLQGYWPKIPVRWGPTMSGEKPVTNEAFDVKQVGDSLFVTTEAGISILDVHTRHWTTIRPPDVPGEPRLRNIEAENDRTWWIRSFSAGVFVFDPVSRQFTKHYRNGDTCRDCLPPEINLLARDADGKLMLTTSKGLFAYDRARDAFRKIGIVGSPAPSIRLFGMTFDKKGVLWVGAENGLFAVDPGSGKLLKTFQENTKIGYVFRICTDQEQNIWFTSNSGYWCWLRHSDKVVHFEYSLGLPRVEEGASYKGEDGSIYEGAGDALVRFYPDRLLRYKVSAQTKIMEALVNDTLAPIALDAEGQRTVTLSPEESSLSVNFDVINYDLISTNQFFYRLSPDAKEWQQSQSGHLYFYNLQPGSYTLEVRGASKMTGQITNIDSLRILVRPKWYQTDWFKLVVALVVGLFVYALLQYRIRTVRREGTIKQKMTEIEMTALRAQMNPHFIFNSLNSIENFIMQNDKRQASDYLNKFATLIRLILENSRKQAVSIAQDMEALQLYVDLERLRFDNKFHYIADIDRILLEGDYRVAPLLIQPFVENAIVHGLAPSENKDLYLRVSVRLLEDQLHYTIEDNGIGRSASMMYNKRRKIGHKSLGLEISRERIGSNGSLEVLDLYDKEGTSAGTRVELTIKIA